MTGTALTEATEFMKIYEMPVVEIPTHRPMVRDDHNDQIYKTKHGKWKAVVNEIERAPRERPADPRRDDLGRGLGDALRRADPRTAIEHVVLNAKPEHAQREGETIAAGGAHRARSRSPPTWRAAASTSSSAATPSRWPRRAAKARPHARRRELRGGARRADRAELKEQCEAEGEKVIEARRPVHLRHRAPRVAADRQPASRPLRAARATRASRASSSRPRTT